MTKKINESIRVKYMTKVTLRFLKEKGYFGTIINIDRKFDMLRAILQVEKQDSQETLQHFYEHLGYEKTKEDSEYIEMKKELK